MSAVMVPRNQLLLSMIQKEFPGYHPLLSIARIAHDADADLKLQFEAHKTVAKYVEPELKSIEVRGGVETHHRVRVSLFDPIEGECTVVPSAIEEEIVELQELVPYDEMAVSNNW